MSAIAHPEKVLHTGEPGPGCPPEKKLAPKWFAVYTTPRREKRVEPGAIACTSRLATVSNPS